MSLLAHRRVFGQVRAVRLVLDDALAPKKGPDVFGIGSHRDAVRSTKRQWIFCFGHCWVALAVLVPVPFSTRTWSLPLLWRLYRTKKDCARQGVPHRKKTALAREILDVFTSGCRTSASSWLRIPSTATTPSRTIWPSGVVLFGAMRPDAVLTELPVDVGRGAQGGRSRKRGRLLRKPQQVARDGHTPGGPPKPRCTVAPRQSGSRASARRVAVRAEGRILDQLREAERVDEAHGARLRLPSASPELLGGCRVGDLSPLTAMHWARRRRRGRCYRRRETRRAGEPRREAVRRRCHGQSAAPSAGPHIVTISR